MRAVRAAIVAASVVVVWSGAMAACPPQSARNCVVNLNLTPEVSQQIVAGDAIPPAPAKAPPVVPIPTYNGPIIGAAPNMGRAPEIGFRWETD
jgi:hypothetical protein